MNDLAARPPVDPSKPPTPEEEQVDRIVNLRHEAEDWLSDDSLFHAEDGAVATRRRITDAAVLMVEGKRLRVNDGLDHITGLLTLVEHGATAGVNIPHTVLQDGERQPQSVWTEAGRRAVLAAAAYRENHVESAHAMVRQKYEAQASIRDDTNRTLDEREAAGTKALKIVEDYPAQLAAAMAAYDPHTLPDDLPTLKCALVERLESAATAKLKELTGAESQNGIDLHPACVSEGDAMTDISEAKKIGQIRIERASTREKAKEAAKKAEEAINAVSALRTPIFERLAATNVYEAINTAEVTFKEKTVTIRGRHPNWRESRHRIPGEVSLFGHPETGEDGTIPAGVYGIYTAPETPSELGEMDVQLVVPPGTKATFKLTCRNICGPSFLAVTLDAPAE